MYCPPITITFLGTGTSTGVPMIACPCPVCTSKDAKDNRLRSSLLVQSSTTTFVIDTTPDFRYQMLRQKVASLDAVLFTHPHKDHIAGLDDVKAFNFFSGNAMQVYANTLTQDAIKREFMYVFAEKKYPGIPQITLHNIDENTPFVIGDIPIIPILVWHLHMPVLGFRIGKFTYITDANKIDAIEQQKIVGSQMVVLNALRHAPHLSHFTLDEAVALIQSLKIPQARFTHISHQLGLHQTTNNALPIGMELAFDGLQLQFT